MPIFAIGKIFCWTRNIRWLQVLRRKASPTISRCIYKTWVSIPMTITISFKVTKDNCWKFSKHKSNILWYWYVKLIYIVPSGGSVEGTGVVDGVVVVVVVVNVGSASFGNMSHWFSPSKKMTWSMAINEFKSPPLLASNSI